MQTDKFNELGEKPVGRLLLQYAVPAIIAMTAASLYNIIDGIFIGQGVGDKAIMGLALTAPIMSLTAAFGAMVGVGAATLMSIRLGQKDYASAGRILGNVILMNVAMGLLLGVVLQVFLDPILFFFGASQDTLPYAHDFMTVILTGNVVTHLYLGLNAMLRSTNRPKLAMYATFGSVGINALLAPLFIFVLGWGIRGAALATIVAQCCMLAWQLRLFSDKREFIHLRREILRPEPRIMRDSLTIGLPQFLINACSCLVAIIITRSMASYGGDVYVGAFGITNRLLMFVVFVVVGLNQGMQPIAGYNFGAGRYDRLERVIRLTILVASCFTGLGFLVGMFLAEPCVAIFAKDAPELIHEAAHGLRIVVLFFPVVGMQIVSTAFFQSIGSPGKSIFLSLSRQLIFLVPALLLLPHLFDTPTDGVWYAMPLADALASLLSFTLLVRQIRKMRRATASAA
ncbi:MAG: MATE family efflux transporter [Bacteroidales bacterium]|nr:MATE family efflux transporter [Bacteroidales bacterium]